MFFKRISRTVRFLIWIRAALPGRCALFLKICREKGREPERARKPPGDGVAGGPGALSSFGFWEGESLPRPWPPGGGRAACGHPTLSISPTPQKPQSNRIETTVRRVPQAENGGRKAVGKRSDRGAAPLLLAYPFFPALSRGRRIFNRRFDHRISPGLLHGNRPEAGRTEFALHAGTLCAVALYAKFCPATVFAARFRLHFAKPAVRKGRGKERRRETIEREEEERERKRGAEKRPRFRSFTLRARGAVENFFGGKNAVENCFPGGGRTGFIRCPD